MQSNTHLLGQACSWISTSTGLPQVGYIVAIRLDERVQTWCDKYSIPDGLPWRPLALVTVGNTGPTVANADSNTSQTYKIFGKNLRKGITENMLKQTSTPMW